MTVHDLVTRHYGASDGARDLTDRIVTALTRHGVDVQHLRVRELAPLDELHAGGPPATQYLLEQLRLRDGEHLLDVGSGIGGPSRWAAEALPVTVTGIDLTPEFVRTAEELTERTGLADRVNFVRAPGGAMPFDDDTFDAAMMIHVGMNVDDKGTLFSEVHRVLKHGAAFAVFDQMRAGPGDLPYPLPWAVDARSSFVESPERYAERLGAAGFTVEAIEDRTSQLGPVPGPGALGPQVVFGPEFTRRLENNVRATDDGLLAAVLVLARA
ncbi:MAG TPA: class I SAM-dependent methyltransferase [Actinomycetales bacterium]|nr:class I SAM-dependent methyltransferase [Actinomycetales bacterium]